MKNKTDWTKYYKGRKSFFSKVTQRCTLDKILLAYRTVSKPETIGSVLELGGGASCFAEEFCKRCKILEYDIIDNNEYAVSIFEDKRINCARHKGILRDLTEEISGIRQYDFVYSIGLIEHFCKENREKIIKTHFTLCKEGGSVLISFPTPTFKYRFWRRIMEVLHVWQFHDETPLEYGDIQDVVEALGDVISVEINRRLFLTQMIVLCNKKGICSDETDK